MSGSNSPYLKDTLSKHTAIFGLRLWVILGITIGVAFVLLLILFSLWLASKRRPKAPLIPVFSKEIQEIEQVSTETKNENVGEVDQKAFLKDESIGEESMKRIYVEIGKGCRIENQEKQGSTVDYRASAMGPEVSHLGWGHWYTLRELELATDGFSDKNVIGEGGYGIVYRGVLHDGAHVAVKNLLNNRGQAEREFKVEVEAIGRVRHKHLVRLLGFCVEGANRVLVYEFVDNGNLEQWLHGNMGPTSPLNWDIRMSIILGTAKGITYLHEGLEPKVVHRDIKSSNILLDKNWNPKVSDFGLAKLLGSERSYVTTRVMGTFGYVAPEYASTGMLNERSDVYSFGILIMEIISGRNPVDYSRPPGEVNLVEWLKIMVTNRSYEGVLDPKLPEKPSIRALKKILLVALRCVDPDLHKRPKMGHVVHMLEVDDFPYRDDRRPGQSYRESPLENASLLQKRVPESGNNSGNEGSAGTRVYSMSSSWRN
ncbi:Protein kinase superfamily protein [Rhynchospora pubera]|uniref:non-specific serine/threonine protein kinase n=1 Tax=Rhynchospora pubera TaxID=906938 RepID=A0AAV8H537_9POAL|nr:Protein kinase superfamily protein [Rhynchospora pubera]KAJ4758470.1 Protein kinase superfamily protein [Rhynchospora pubera]KAJ4810916.1 Protein kinase superfamily protein [Rhynchospora pubera]